MEKSNITKKILTVAMVSKITGITVQHIRLLIRDGKIPAEKFGREWVIHEKFAKKVKRKNKLSSKVKENKENERAT